MTVLQALLEQAQATPNAEAIVFENEIWTYQELVDKAQKIAQFLVEKGYKKDEIVAQFTLNSNAFMAIYYGVQLAGLTVMPVNTKLAPPEIDFIFRHSEAKVLIFDEKLQATVDATTYTFEHVVSLTEIESILQSESNQTLP